MKLLFFIAVIIVFCVIVRRMSSHSISAENYRPPEAPNPEPVTIDAKKIEDPVASRYEVTQYRFATIDAEHGPPDPESFYDDLFVDVTNRETGEKFTNLMHVCTPKGLKEEMSAQKQGTLLADELLVVLRYDLGTIRQGVEEYLSRMYDCEVSLQNGVL